VYPKTTSLQEVCLQLGLRLLDVIFGHLIQFAQRNAGLQCSDEKVEDIEQNSIVLFLVLVETVRVRKGITAWEGIMCVLPHRGQRSRYVQRSSNNV